MRHHRHNKEIGSAQRRLYQRPRRGRCIDYKDIVFITDRQVSVCVHQCLHERTFTNDHLFSGDVVFRGQCIE